ncbi:formate/nitrite transporter family protein [Shigella flexneri]
MSYCGRSLCDKIVAMILPITLFVAMALSTVLANLFVIRSPLPFAISPPPLLATGARSRRQFPALTVSHLITANLLPVMLGNVIGGAVLVSMCYRAIYCVRNPEKSARRNSSSG